METLSVVEPEVLTDAGLNETVAPCGNPFTLNATVPTKPVPEVTVAVYVVLPPARTVPAAGVADSEKSGTVMVRVAGGLTDPPLSVAVNEAT